MSKTDAIANAKVQLGRLPREVLEDALTQFGCREIPNGLHNDELIELILDYLGFDPHRHLSPVTQLEEVVCAKARAKQIDDQVGDRVKPLTESASAIQKIFVTIGTVASVIVGVSALYGFNLNVKLQEQQESFKVQRDELEEGLRDLEKVTAELRRDRRDEAARTAVLERFYLKAEIHRFQQALDRILEVSLQLDSQRIITALKDIKPHADRWQTLREQYGGTLETKREMRIIGMQIEFIETTQRFVEFKNRGENPGKQSWSSAFAAVTHLTEAIEALGDLDGASDHELRNDILAYAKLAKLDLDKGAGAASASDVEALRGKLRRKIAKDLETLTDQLDSGRRREINRDHSALITRALSYAYVMCSHMERMQNDPDMPVIDRKPFLERAIECARKATLADSSSAQAYAELSRDYRAMAQLHSDEEIGERDQYLAAAERAIRIAVDNTDPKEKPAEALFVRNNMAYSYLRRAAFEKDEAGARGRIKRGLKELGDINEAYYRGLGTERDVAILTKAELLIAELFLDFDKNFDALKSDWQSAQCSRLVVMIDQTSSATGASAASGPATQINGARVAPDTNKLDGDPALRPSKPQTRDVVYQRISKILHHLVDVGEFGRAFYRHKEPGELKKSSPYLCAFARLRLADANDSERTNADDLRELQREIGEIFQLKEEAPQSESST